MPTPLDSPKTSGSGPGAQRRPNLPYYGMVQTAAYQPNYYNGYYGYAVPVGYYPGKAIWSAGTKWTVPLALGTALIWQGKDFDPCTMLMTNKNWFPSTKAKVFYGPSWLDGQPSIIMDYAETSKLVGTVRDEIREVRPGLYLGIMFVRRDSGCHCKFRNFFVLEAKPSCCCPCGDGR